MDIGICRIGTTVKTFIVNNMELGGGICHTQTHTKMIHKKRPRMITHQLNTKSNNMKAFLAA